MAEDENSPERLGARIEDLDLELFCVQRNVYNSHWPSVALAAALIDQGVVDKDGLLAIIEALHDVASAHAEPGYGEDDLLALDLFRSAVDQLELSRGSVLAQIRKQAASSQLVEILRAMQRRKRE